MRRLIASMSLSLLLALASTSSALAHDGGHTGGCAEFGHINRPIGQDPAAFGFPWARNLGDIVENVDHVACG